MNINWYPGHMKKTKESIQNNLKLVDVIFELIDARIPYSSRNPMIDMIVGDKARVIILNKSDLADSKVNIIWQDFFNKSSIPSVLIDALKGKGIDKLISLSNEVTSEKRLAYAKKGVKNLPIRAMIIGIPNVGKSTLINTLTERRGAKTGNKPGITKSNQWIKTKGNLELLDTPGILWPKFEDQQVGLNLAFTGAIKDEILDVETLALRFIEDMIKIYPELLIDRYKVNLEDKTALEILDSIGRIRGCIVKGGEIDYTKAGNIILDDFRKGNMGRITLELPES
ncbi:ribosome biogenesis GTPase YlqF [Paratissierella segnis]|uniref:Ribosome biogenesis GTPase A n=1 Tax=Paratissierella segnis TaxID=2763679 RepID=A0A926ETV9_9FIRM|nr:ribosome biogenesis GTPase YlqF [Paratissierella segnis]MBC8588806.1 ribosome biogenesis GTPase YlqF [Paratissierella segnis]